jgi:hypothetical protein
VRSVDQLVLGRLHAAHRGGDRGGDVGLEPAVQLGRDVPLGGGPIILARSSISGSISPRMTSSASSALRAKPTISPWSIAARLVSL